MYDEVIIRTKYIIYYLDFQYNIMFYKSKADVPLLTAPNLEIMYVEDIIFIIIYIHEKFCR